MGEGVAIDKERSALFERMGMLRGEIVARHNIGCLLIIVPLAWYVVLLRYVA